MIELKSIDKSEQRSVNILSQFWIESDNRSSQRYWILKLIYQNYTTSTLYYYICLPSSDIQLDIHTTWLPLLGIKPCSFSTSITILLIGHWKSLMLLFNVSITFSWTLCTVPCESSSVLTIHAIGHLFLLVSSLSNTTSPTWNFFCLYSIFVVLGDSEGILFTNGTKIPWQYAALVSITYMSTGLVYWTLLAVA